MNPTPTRRRRQPEALPPPPEKTPAHRPVEDDIPAVIRELRKAHRMFREPVVTRVSRQRDPFKVLVSCILSLRTKDEVTAAASRRLFALADTPAALKALPQRKIEKAIFPVGFYRTKAARLREIAARLLTDYGGRTPSELEELLTLPGVGRKTANLVVTLGFGKPGICVDTHVHRISNRLGLTSTKTPEKTEFALREILPERYWIEFNDLLVTYGQNVCTPTSPWCSRCRLTPYCRRVGVTRSR